MGRSPCCEKQHVNKGAWTKEEDERLINYIKTNGDGCWRSLPKSAGLQRCGKSCRLRWTNYLRPDLKRGNFTEEEDELIIKLHGLLGNKWSLIATRLPGRTDNEIKNYWNTHIKRKLLTRGIDPQTHCPIKSPPTTIINNATTTKTTSTNKDGNRNKKDNFRLINMQGSTLQFGIASRFDITTPNDTGYTIPLIKASNFSEDSNNSSNVTTNHEGYGEINLELSISLPSTSKFSTNNVTKEEQEEITYQILTTALTTPNKYMYVLQPSFTYV